VLTPFLFFSFLFFSFLFFSFLFFSFFFFLFFFFFFFFFFFSFFSFFPPVSQNHKLSLPAPYFLTTFFNSFRYRIEEDIPETSSDSAGDSLFQASMEKMKAKDYAGAFADVHAALEGDTTFKVHALNLRGTFHYLKGDFAKALEDLNAALELNPRATNVLIKRASVHFEAKDVRACMDDFDKALLINSDDPDIYYHRGQMHFIMGDLSAALTDYQRSLKLDSSVPFVHVQLAVIYFRSQATQNSIDTFKEALEKFPNYGDLYNYYGEVLVELQKYEEASENFDKGEGLFPLLSLLSAIHFLRDILQPRG